MPVSSKGLENRTGLILFVMVFFLYSVLSPGNLPGDTEVRWSVARQMVRGGSVSLEEGFHTRNYAVGVDGRRYSLWGVGQSVLLVPFAGLGVALEKAGGLKAETADLFAQFLASVLLFAGLGAVGVWVFYRVGRVLNYNRRAAVAAAVVFAAGSMHLHYSACTQEQSQIAFFLLAALYFFIKQQGEKRFRDAWLMCVMLGAAILWRMDSVVMAVPLYVTAIIVELISTPSERNKSVGKWVCAAMAGTLPFVLVVFWYNYARFGNILENGNSLVAARIMAGEPLFSGEPAATLVAMLFSPGKSIFLYNPVLLLAVVFSYRFFRRHGAAAIAAGVVVIANFVFYSFYTTWTGDYAWGLRFAEPVMGFLLLGLLELFAQRRRGWKRYAVGALVTASVGIQCTSVVYNFNLEFLQNPNHCLIPDEYVWQWGQSHLVKRFENIGRHILGRRDFSSVPVVRAEPRLLRSNTSEETVRNSYYVNLYPFKARHMQSAVGVFGVLLALWLMEVTVFVVLAAILARSCRAAAEAGG